PPSPAGNRIRAGGSASESGSGRRHRRRESLAFRSLRPGRECNVKFHGSVPKEHTSMPTRHDRKVSILDVMGPVMVGPSSSHTAGTARLGRVAREILDEDPVDVKFIPHPPLAATYRGHGSDFALVGGSIGLNVDDPRIPEAIRIAEQMGVNIVFT